MVKFKQAKLIKMLEYWLVGVTTGRADNVLISYLGVGCISTLYENSFNYIFRISVFLYTYFNINFSYKRKKTDIRFELKKEPL